MKDELLKKANDCLQAAKSTAEEIAKDERVQKVYSKAQGYAESAVEKAGELVNDERVQKACFKAGEYAGAAMDKAQEIAKDERVQAAVGKAEEYAKTVKDKVVEVANDERVVAAKNKVAEYALPWWKKICVAAEPVLKKEGTQKVIKGVLVGYGWTCNWTKTNWQAGRNGRIKVVAAGVALLFVVGTVFSMGGGSSDGSSASSSNGDNGGMTEDEQAVAALAMLLGGGEGGGGGGGGMRGWMCGHKGCCAIEYSASKPYGGSCSHGGTHYWLEKGRAGSTVYKCHHCGALMRMGEKPWSGGECPGGAGHFWNQVY